MVALTDQQVSFLIHARARMRIPDPGLEILGWLSLFRADCRLPGRVSQDVIECLSDTRRAVTRFGHKRFRGVAATRRLKFFEELKS